MKLNDALIEHYRTAKIPLYELKKLVNLDPEYLKEKSTWYDINGNLHYFKKRDDLRLFTELFFTEFAREIVGLNSVEYEVAHVRTIDPVVSKKEEEHGIGLLSLNFQTQDNDYYLVRELMDSSISTLRAYGDYSLVTLLTFFKSTVAEEEYKNIEDFLVKLFIADGFTMQLDRNYNNIGFQIPKIDGVTYKQRLNPEMLERLKKADGNVVLEDSTLKLRHMVPSKVYDSERILGIDHNFVFLYKPGDVWTPLFPYNKDLLFTSQEQAKETSEAYDGLDPNLVELFIDFPTYRPLLERLAYDDEYKKILERYIGSAKPIQLSDQERENVSLVMESRRKEFQKVLSL